MRCRCMTYSVGRAIMRYRVIREKTKRRTEAKTRSSPQYCLNKMKQAWNKLLRLISVQIIIRNRMWHKKRLNIPGIKHWCFRNMRSLSYLQFSVYPAISRDLMLYIAWYQQDITRKFSRRVVYQKEWCVWSFWSRSMPEIVAAVYQVTADSAA